MTRFALFRSVWLLSFLSLFISQSCLAAAAQQSHVSDKSDHAAGVFMHPGSNNMNNMAWIISTAGIMVLLVSTVWHMTRGNRQFEEEQENNGETTLLGPIQGGTRNDYSYDPLPGSENLVGSQDSPWFSSDAIHRVAKFFCFEIKISDQVGSQDLHLFRLDVILRATNHFSVENKIGEGRFGCVYKGQLASGELIAVKRLSRSVGSGQGPREFQNEATSISKLRQKNLVRFLGCCTERNELLLVYEYMANRSLDDVLFDSTRSVLLDWKTRMNIINGIGRGLLYLHEDFGFKMIHRDLKPSNILLDDKMDPRISDFGLSRIFNDYESEVSTAINAGTIGYLAPEYVLKAQISVKSDVFSFGIILLEIIGVKKSSRLYILEHGMRLLDYIWELWCEGQALELMDRALLQSCDVSELLRCIHIGLLCVQEDPTIRPTMSSVVVMLASDDLLPKPTQPAFFYRRSIARSSQFLSDSEDDSVNEMTHSISNLPQTR